MMSMSEMKVVDFVAAPPAGNSDVFKLQHTFESFNSVRKKVRYADKRYLCSTENQDKLAHELGVDRFMVEDVIDVLLDREISLDFADFIDRGFWTRGRQVPRFGIPWGSIVFYDVARNVELLVRHAGSFVV